MSWRASGGEILTSGPEDRNSSGSPTLADLTVEELVEYWNRQARKLAEAGVPWERIAESMTIAGLNAEKVCLEDLASRLKENLAKKLG